MSKAELDKKMKSLENKAEKGKLKLAEWKAMSQLMKESFRNKDINKNEFLSLIAKLSTLSGKCKAQWTNINS